jgi:hypothetical protein
MMNHWRHVLVPHHTDKQSTQDYKMSAQMRPAIVNAHQSGKAPRIKVLTMFTHTMTSVFIVSLTGSLAPKMTLANNCLYRNGCERYGMVV